MESLEANSLLPTADGDESGGDGEDDGVATFGAAASVFKKDIEWDLDPKNVDYNSVFLEKAKVLDQFLR